MNAEEFVGRWVEDIHSISAYADMKELYTRLLTIGFKIGQMPEGNISDLKEVIAREIPEFDL